MATKRTLLTIDGQVDFCDPSGSLYVPGADQDMTRLAAHLMKFGHVYSDIKATLDSHRRLHIAHPDMWINSKKEHPAPFTIITLADIDAGTWNAALLPLAQKQRDYVAGLEANGRYPLCIWPVHCLIGSPGQAIFKPLFEAFCNWEVTRFGSIDYLTKGSNIFTEHYSAVKADVEDPNDNTTRLNTDFITSLMDADEVVLTGEAKSHCLANTILDTIDVISPEAVKKFVLLKDATSSVPGFEKLGDDFEKLLVSKGGRVSTTVDYL